MKTILEDVQLAIAGTGEDGRVISGDLLRIIASNFKGNQYPQILKGSLREKAKTHEFVGYVTSVYFKECDGESALFGDLEFVQFYDMSTLKETFANGVYPAIEIINSHPGYESLYRLAFTNKPFIKGLRMVNFRNCVCVGREEQTQEKLDSESEFLFNKKYDNEKSGFIGYVKNDDVEKSTTQDSPFIHAPGLSRKELIDWLNDVSVALCTEKSDYARRAADIEKKKQDINNDLNKRMETLKKAFPQLDPESILSQDRKVISI